MSGLYSNSFSFPANSTGYSNTTDTIHVTNANTYISVNNMVKYVVPLNNTAIQSLQANGSYYVSFVNSSALALSETKGGANVNLTSMTLETHVITLLTHNNTALTIPEDFSFTVNSVIYIDDANTYFTGGDYVQYVVPSPGTPMVGLTPDHHYYVYNSNSTAITLCSTQNATAALTYHPNTDFGETHYLLLNANVNSLVMDSNNNMSIAVYDSANSLNVSYTSANIQFNNLPIFFCRAYASVSSSGSGDIGDTYSQTGTTISVTSSVNHNLKLGDIIYGMFTSGTAVNNFFTVATTPSNTTYTFTDITSRNTSGGFINYSKDLDVSGNIKFISSDANGTYYAIFSTPMGDTNYSVVVNIDYNSQNNIISTGITKAANNFRIITYANGVAKAIEPFSFAVFK